jgi:hypothetical protein
VIRGLAAVGLATDVHLLPKDAEGLRIRPRAQTWPAAVAA